MSSVTYMFSASWAAIGGVAAIVAAIMSIATFGLLIFDRLKALAKVDVREVEVIWRARSANTCTNLFLKFVAENRSAADDVLLAFYAETSEWRRLNPYSWSTSRMPPCVLAPNLPYHCSSDLGPSPDISFGESVDGTITFELQRAGKVSHPFVASCTSG